MSQEKNANDFVGMFPNLAENLIVKSKASKMDKTEKTAMTRYGRSDVKFGYTVNALIGRIKEANAKLAEGDKVDETVPNKPSWNSLTSEEQKPFRDYAVKMVARGGGQSVEETEE